MQGWVELCYVKVDRPGIEPRPVSPKSNALPLSHHATQTVKKTRINASEQYAEETKHVASQF